MLFFHEFLYVRFFKGVLWKVLMVVFFGRWMFPRMLPRISRFCFWMVFRWCASDFFKLSSVSSGEALHCRCSYAFLHFADV